MNFTKKISLSKSDLNTQKIPLAIREIINIYEEIEVSADVDLSPGKPAHTNDLPENCYPAEPGTIEWKLTFTHPGTDIEIEVTYEMLSSEGEDRISNYMIENAPYDDGSDYGDWKYEQTRDGG